MVKTGQEKELNQLIPDVWRSVVLHKVGKIKSVAGLVFPGANPIILNTRGTLQTIKM